MYFQSSAEKCEPPAYFCKLTKAHLFMTSVADTNNIYAFSQGRKKEPEDTAKEEQKEDRKAKRRVKEDTASEQSESKTNTDEE